MSPDIWIAHRFWVPRVQSPVSAPSVQTRKIVDHVLAGTVQDQWASWCVANCHQSGRGLHPWCICVRGATGSDIASRADAEDHGPPATSPRQGTPVQICPSRHAPKLRHKKKTFPVVR